MAEHGTRTMYVHYGCRCDACCRAEHQQYLKRKEAQARKRTYSKWGDIEAPAARESQRRNNARRWYALTKRPSTHAHPISWKELIKRDGTKCAICGENVDPEDTWEKNGRLCFGRKYPTVDHIIPLIHGGTDTLDNVQLLCKHCNSVKGAKLYESAV